MPRVRTFLAVATLLAAACNGTEKPGLDFPSTQATAPSADPPPSPADRSAGSAATAMDALCVEPVFPSPSPVAVHGAVSPEIAQLEQHVEEVRGLRYLDPVSTEAVTGAEMARRVTGVLRLQYPRDLYARRTQAWATIGVLPAGVSLRDALVSFGQGGIVGYYDPSTGELVYIATGELGFGETLTLAHELTHAIDDQHFDLTRIDRFVNGCRDEEFLAAVGAVEGSAQFFASRVLREFPAPIGADDVAITGDLSILEQVPPFLLELQVWPYNYGQAFMIALERRGGLRLVNQALKDLPVSTEQVLHPERYPNDLPQAVDVPALDVAGWKDLDVMQVGEEWLRAMLGLRLDRGTADGAAAGWDGGIYRAWSSPQQVAVVLRTVWDSPLDARQFRDAMDLWVSQGDEVAEARVDEGTTVTVVFSTDDASRELVTAALPA